MVKRKKLNKRERKITESDIDKILQLQSLPKRRKGETKEAYIKRVLFGKKVRKVV